MEMAACMDMEVEVEVEIVGGGIEERRLCVKISIDRRREKKAAEK